MKDKEVQGREKTDLQLKNKKKQKLKEKGITLIALVVTIIILLILAGVTITFSLGENGLIGKAKEARKAQIIGETKEAIGLEITEAYTEAVLRGESLEKKQVEDIVNKYGELQKDGDTIITKKGGYKISLKDIYYGVLSDSGNYSAKVDQIEMLEKKVTDLTNENADLKKLSDLKVNSIMDMNLGYKSGSGISNYEVNKPRNFESETMTIIVIARFDNRFPDNSPFLRLTNADLVKTMNISCRDDFNATYCWVYKTSESSFKINFVNNLDVCLGYILLDKEYKNFELKSSDKTSISTSYKGLNLIVDFADSRHLLTINSTPLSFYQRTDGGSNYRDYQSLRCILTYIPDEGSISVSGASNTHLFNMVIS